MLRKRRDCGLPFPANRRICFDHIATAPSEILPGTERNLPIRYDPKNFLRYRPQQHRLAGYPARGAAGKKKKTPQHKKPSSPQRASRRSFSGGVDTVERDLGALRWVQIRQRFGDPDRNADPQTSAEAPHAGAVGPGEKKNAPPPPPRTPPRSRTP